MRVSDNILSYFRKNRKKCVMLLLLSLGILFIIISAVSGESGETSTLAEYKEELEEELEKLCESIDGVGSAKVTVSFSEGEVRNYKGSSLISSEPPRISGITVVCRGGGSYEVRERVSSAMTALFDIGANRVCVLEMKK